MSNVLVVTREKENARNLQTRLSELGHASSSMLFRDYTDGKTGGVVPELILMETDGQNPASLRQLVQGLKAKYKAAVLALVTNELLKKPDDYLEVDDFIVQPFGNRELALRITRLVKKNEGQNEILRFGNLRIDLDNCEVRVAGRTIELTFKEYELLKFLVKERGRVFTRETLLNKVWGYDYFGGDRTVDVHVRRLRSKIETTEESYIETVRNIGYRFKKG
jgi:DNA-binding response OmpR family regulator